MFERFTERARQVVVLAQDEARLLKHNYIGTEHILLGLLREDEGIAARVLESLGLTTEEVRAEVGRIVGHGDEVTTGQIPFTPRGKKVLELSLSEALSLGHSHIGTEHVLLGVAREGEGVASRILLDFGVTSEAVREAVVTALSGGIPPEHYVPMSPPVAKDVLDELERLVSEKARAVEENELDAAAAAEERRRRLVRAARDLERAWKNEPTERARRTQMHREESLRFDELRFGLTSFERAKRLLVVGWLLFAAALGVGILVGWAVWG